jgi:hypothetical protein
MNSIGGVSKRGQTTSIHVYNNTGNDDVSAADYFTSYFAALSPGDIIKVIGIDKISFVDYVVYQANSSGAGGVVINQILAGAIGAVTTVEVEATLAEINAGKVLVATSGGKQILVTQLKAVVDGDFADGTQVEVEDDNATAIQVATYPLAGLTDGNSIDENSSDVALQSGYLTLLTVDKNLVVNKGAGSDFTGGTKITFTVSYQYV